MPIPQDRARAQDSTYAPNSTYALIDALTDALLQTVAQHLTVDGALRAFASAPLGAQAFSSRCQT